MKNIVVLIFIVFSSLSLLAQNENDALRYSLLNYGGTARFTGMSGAYGAIGADFSSLSQNPAGIGMYRKTEFSVTPMFNTANTTSKYLTESNSDNRNTMYLGNIGYVYSMKFNSNESAAIKQIQLGFGINSTSTFSNRIVMEGLNLNNSLLTYYLDDAIASGVQRENLYDYGAGMAYDVNLLFPDSINIWQVDLPYGGNNQLKTIETRGHSYETVISAGTNYNEKLFMGITFAFPHVRYEEESYYTEKDVNDLSPFLKSFQQTDYLKTTGSGFNLKIGFIYKPFDFLRIGGAFHTPTAYSLNDAYSSKMVAEYDQPPLIDDNSTTFATESPDGAYDYRLTTPMRAMGSLAFIIGQYGLISADYEYIDYSSARLRANDYNFLGENENINSTLTSAHNVRVGTEWKAGIFAFRGGYSMNGSPYKGGGKIGERTGYSFGLGIREQSYFLDFSYSHSSSEINYFFYSDAPASLNKIKNNSFNLTLGFRL